MVRRCVLCRTSYGGAGRTFHRFPQDPERRVLWLSMINKETTSIGKEAYLCSDHFAEKDIVVKPSGHTYLRPNAMPIPPLEPLQQRQTIAEPAGVVAHISKIFESTSSMELVPATDQYVHGSTTETASETEEMQVDVLPSTEAPTGTTEDVSQRYLQQRPIDVTSSSRKPLMVTSSSSTLSASDKENIPYATMKTRKMVTPRYFGDCSTSDMDNPVLARRNWLIAKKRIISQNKRIKNLKESNRRLRDRITSLNSLFKYLKTNFSIGESAQSVIEASVSGPARLILERMIKGHRRQKYSAELRAFALTLSFYSTRAYSYLRQKFNYALPHLSTISKWFRSVNGKPGFSEEVLNALKSRVDAMSKIGKKMICNLVIDEKSIMRRIEWDGSKFVGYTDLGIETVDDNTPEAKEALVFMLVAVNDHWKIPVAYFLTAGLNGSSKANLVNKLLLFLSEVDVTVSSLTFDGAASNLTMCKSLGANFENHVHLKPYFEHPVTKKPIYIFLDICHMVKLVRNCLASKGNLIDGEQKNISWSFFQKLDDIQNKEGLHAATKLSSRHLQWHREKMKVRLATQAFSNSVADALLFLCKDLNLIEFRGVEGTAQFTKIFNNLFDIFNTRTMFSKYAYKKALSATNYHEILQYLEFCKDYILRLKVGSELVLNSKSKTGFLGFLVGIESLKSLYKIYVIETPLLKYICTYKYSQDHLEIFFSAIRRRGGNNNNPTARQFEHSYKRLLVHTEIKGSETANAVALDNTSILCVSSSITKSQIGGDMQESEQYLKLTQNLNDLDFLESQAWHLTAYVDDIVAYIAGFVTRCLKTCVTCKKCILILEGEICYSKLQERKKRGNLINASRFVLDICKTAEKTIRVFIEKFNIFQIRNLKNLVINKALRNMPYTIYSVYDDHFIENDIMNNHLFELIKLVLDRYLNLRLHHETNKLKNKTVNRIRSVFTKTVLFQNQ